ncbi:MAG: dihydroorotate dehydrogenase B catalytic subunit [Thermoplasmata archaeon]|nr:dihydroorotate dehydrogenase B catalytic subunit [Thermoplasmata archaeon]
MAQLTVHAPGLDLPNPLMLASGLQGGSVSALERVAKSRCGGLVSKSIGPSPREIYPGPVCVEAMNGVILNAMGLPNPGVDAFSKMLANNEFAKPMLVSIFGPDSESFSNIAIKMEKSGATALELNLSCPHSKPGSTALIVGQQPNLIHEYVSAVKDVVNIPVYAKLTPNTASIAIEAGAALNAGADGISLINTVSALEIDPFAGRPIIGNLLCGMSGPTIRPIAQRKIAEVALAMRRGDIPVAPILGMGGITTGLDVARFIMLGATAVQIGSALIYDDIDVFETIEKELNDFMDVQGFRDLESMRGIALDSLEGLN